MDKKRLLVNFALSLFSLLFACALAEAATRFFWSARYSQEETHYSFNSRGLRDYEYPYQKPPGVFRILGLGDSTTFGQGVVLEDTYLKKLEKRLNEAALDPRFEVINCGRQAWNTTQELEFLRTEGLKYQPDMLIVGFSLNDPEPVENTRTYALASLLPPLLEERLAWSYFYFFIRFRYSLFLEGSGLKSSYVDYLKVLYDPARNEGWPEFVAALKGIAEVGRELGIKVLLVLSPVMARDFDRYPFLEEHRQVRDLGLQSGMLVVESLPYFQNQGLDGTSLWVTPWDAHPNAFAHQLFSDAIYQALVDNDLIIEDADASPSGQ